PGGYAVGSEVDVRVVPHLLRRLGDALDETGGLGEGPGGEVGVGPAEEDPPVLDAVGLMEDVGRHPFVGHGCIQLARPNACGGSFRGWYRDAASPLECVTPRGCRLVVRHELPKLGTRVRFPSPAPSSCQDTRPRTLSGKLGTRVRFPSPAPALPPTPASGGGTFPQLRRGTNPEKTNSERGFGSLHRSTYPRLRRRYLPPAPPGDWSRTDGRGTRGLILGQVLVVPRRGRAFLALVLAPQDSRAVGVLGR